MATITIEKGFNLGKTNFKDILELFQYLDLNFEKIGLKKDDLEVEFENFSDKENKLLISKGGKTIDNIFNSLDLQLGK